MVVTVAGQGVGTRADISEWLRLSPSQGCAHWTSVSGLSYRAPSSLPGQCLTLPSWPRVHSHRQTPRHEGFQGNTSLRLRRGILLFSNPSIPFHPRNAGCDPSLEFHGSLVTNPRSRRKIEYFMREKEIQISCAVNKRQRMGGAGSRVRALKHNQEQRRGIWPNQS